MHPITALTTLRALDGLSLRAEATAQNVANAATPHYRPVRVRFEDSLARAAKEGDAVLRAWSPALERLASEEEGSSRLDLELASASATALRYSALVEVLNRQLQIDALAVTGSV
jgi:flagellar basal-body rod protein FlgB